jgi:RNA polymerase sigma factor FliA
VRTARSSNGRNATEDEVADSLGLQIDKFHELLNQVRGISLVNLEEIRGTNSDGDRTGTFADIVEDVNSENPFASFKMTETKRVIAETIAMLPEKERLVVSLYYYEDLNMKEIGGILGITESRVCQIHTKAVLRLRAKLKALLER